MKLAILSGKGGTGKTTISVNLFSSLENVTLIDTDVEEPNSHLFIPYTKDKIQDIFKQYPKIDTDKCKNCGACGNFCNFGAIINAKEKVLVFEDLCHDCGGCKLVCKNDAINYVDKVIGQIHTNYTDNNNIFMYGNLTIGEVSGVKIIEKLRELTKDSSFVIIDSPPGTSCSTIAAVRNTDYAIVVGEPTPFGLSDMKMVVELLRSEKIPFGVIINKAHLGDDKMYQYLEEENIPLIAEVPFQKEYAELYSRGLLISTHSSEFQSIINQVITYIKGVNHERNCDY